MGGFLTNGLARDRYPGAAGYLDAAAVGIPSIDVREAIDEVARRHECLGKGADHGNDVMVSDVRRLIAELVGGESSRVAFTQNTSTALALVTNGIDWVCGDNIVVPAGEFPSNFYPWILLRRHGVIVKEVPMAPAGHAPIEDLADAIDDRTRVLAVSAVQYSTGWRYDLSTLGNLCLGTRTLFVVDGTQAVGALRIDADRSNVDVLAVSAHKWMLGPLGIGFAHLSPRAMTVLHPSVAGWLSVQMPFDFDHEPKLAEDGRRFESGTYNTTGIAGLGAALRHVLDLGRDRVERQVLGAGEYLATALLADGWTVLRGDDSASWSGILLASSGSNDADVHSRLLAAGVRCSLRGAGIRFSPHYYTSQDDLDQALASLSPMR